MNFDLGAAIRDKKTYPDSMEIVVGDGLKLTLGEMRQFQEASGQDVAKQLEAERAKIVEENKKLAAAQEEVVTMWTNLKAAEEKLKAAVPAATGPAAVNDWTKDPFFAPVADYLKSNVEASIAKQAEQIAQFQKALGLGVKYITDTFSEMRYQSLPEDFRKDTPYEAAVKAAAEKKYLDSGGVPDVRKVYDEWQSPRQRKAELEKVQKESYDKGRQDILSNSLARPSGMPVSTAAVDPNAPKTIRESFNRLKEDPEFLNQIYSLTGQA
jgi:hypothetical protein